MPQPIYIKRASAVTAEALYDCDVERRVMVF
jgi:hypothetical protein